MARHTWKRGLPQPARRSNEKIRWREDLPPALRRPFTWIALAEMYLIAFGIGCLIGWALGINALGLRSGLLYDISFIGLGGVVGSATQQEANRRVRERSSTLGD